MRKIAQKLDSGETAHAHMHYLCTLGGAGLNDYKVLIISSNQTILEVIITWVKRLWKLIKLNIIFFLSKVFATF